MNEAKRWLEGARGGDPAGTVLTRACILALTHVVSTKPAVSYDVVVVGRESGMGEEEESGGRGG